MSFVFAQANPRERAARRALPSLRPGYCRLPPGAGLFCTRMLKVVIHEPGRTWSLPPGPDPHCGMRFSSSLDGAGRKRLELSPTCVEKR